MLGSKDNQNEDLAGKDEIEKYLKNQLQLRWREYRRIRTRLKIPRGFVVVIIIFAVIGAVIL